MRKRLPSPALIIGLVALMVALGGTGYGAVRQANDADRATTPSASETSKAKRGKRGRRGPRGRRGRAGANGLPGATGATGATGAAGRSALSNLRSGETIRGVWSVYHSPDLASEILRDTITFPVPASAPLTDEKVVVAGNDTISGVTCSGTADAPTASPGAVCAYIKAGAGTSDAYGATLDDSPTNFLSTTQGSRFGFVISIFCDAAAGGTCTAGGGWAYTAP